MTKYQIQFKYSNGDGTYLYFEGCSDNKELAKEMANEYLKERLEREALFKNHLFHIPFKAPKTITVVEYDTENKCTKRGGDKFKLTLSSFKIIFKDKTTQIEQWYA